MAPHIRGRVMINKYKGYKQIRYREIYNPQLKEERIQLAQDKILNRLHETYFNTRSIDPILTKNAYSAVYTLGTSQQRTTYHPASFSLHLLCRLHSWYQPTTHQPSPLITLFTTTLPFTPLVPAINTPIFTPHRVVFTYCAAYTLGTSRQHTILHFNLPHT